jgi:hypothetical protein
VNVRRLAACLLAASVTLPAAPRAEDAPAAPPATPPAPSATRLSAAQLDTFARMTGRPYGEVAERLAAEPALQDVALRAVEAREARKASARQRAIAGFVILGVGDVIGAVIIVSTPGYPTVESKHQGQVVAGTLVGLATTAVGLVIAIPALVSGGRTGEVEQQAVQQYLQARPQGGTAGARWEAGAPQAGRAVQWPLLSGTF